MPFFSPLAGQVLSLFLEIHKVFLQKNAFIRTQIFSGFALAELCDVALIMFTVYYNTIWITP